MRSNEYQKNVFGDELITLVPELHSFKEEIDVFLAKNLVISETDNQAMLRDIHLAESKISHNLNSANIESFLTDLLPKKEVLLLNDEAVALLLTNNPTIKLDLILPDTILTKRHKIALARFTEDKHWQTKYKQELAATTRANYSKRTVEMFSIDAAVLKSLTEYGVGAAKPWNMSHNKETGTILIFNSDGHTETPHLLRTAIFLHYFYEIFYFASYIEKTPGENIGNSVVQVIAEKKRHFAFLADGNAHDETLYWRKSVSHLIEANIINSVIWSDLLISRGVTASKQSGNFIDLLWNINRIDSKTNHTYHLQQECWLQLLQQIRMDGADTFEQTISTSVIEDNFSFFKKTLKLK